MTAPGKHPTISDVAMSLATRSTPQRMIKATVSDANAKGVVHVTVEVNDPDPAFVGEQVDTLYAVLRAKYPRENGATP